MLETRADKILNLLRTLNGAYKKDIIDAMWESTGQPPLSLYELMAFVGQYVIAQNTYPELCDKDAISLLVKEANRQEDSVKSTNSQRSCSSCGGGEVR